MEHGGVLQDFVDPNGLELLFRSASSSENVSQKQLEVCLGILLLLCAAMSDNDTCTECRTCATGCE